MKKKLFLCSVLLMVTILTSLSEAQELKNTANSQLKQGKLGNVTVQYAIVVPTNLGTLYSVSYSYKFDDKNYIDIKGLGRVPAVGSFKYYTFEQAIEFREAGTRRVLAKVTLDDAIRLMGRSPIELPDESGFPVAYRSGDWVHSTSFQLNTSKILNKHFTSGYIAYEREGINKFLTTYQKLSGMPERLSGEIAVLISYALNSGPNEMSFHLHFKARERRSHSEWREDITEDTKNAAARFTSDLLVDLKEESHGF